MQGECMKLKSIGISLLTVALLCGASSEVSAKRIVYGAKDKEEKAPPKPSNGKEKPFATLIKDKVEVQGLFTIYRDTSTNEVLMSINEDQFNKIYLCNESRTHADGSMLDNGAMTNAYPFYFKKVGNKLMMLEKNIRFRADEESPVAKALDRGISDALIGSTSILSAPKDDSSKAILIDPGDLFIADAENLGFFTAQSLRYRFDKGNSYFGTIKSFPLNTEMDVHLHYSTSTPNNGIAAQNPYSMFLVYHYSLAELKESEGFVPRKLDDRIGYFSTTYQDYTNVDKDSPYVSYINRWNLRKKDPNASMSEPVEPIVYWIENTWPEEFRASAKKGIEFWNQSFEKIGFKNAVVAKIMPDTATWDPADVRYHTLRWMVMPGAGYASGPSRANPFTGEMYDADVRVSSDFLRYMFNNMDNFIGPLSMDNKEGSDSENLLYELEKRNNQFMCSYSSESAREAAAGLTYALATVNTLEEKDALTKKYVNEYLVELVAHEIGHTLGFLHNFKASSIYSLEQIQDPEFNKTHGISGTIMDYDAPNIAPVGKPQGLFYMNKPGQYDDIMVEYSYTDYGNMSESQIDEKLNAILKKTSENGLEYGADYDAFYNQTRSIDPYCSMFDLSNDPIAFSKHKIALTRELWDNAISKFEIEGNNWHKLYSVFATGWRSYNESIVYACKYIGGIKHRRGHIGDPNSTVPFTPLSASEQRRAMKFISDEIFDANAFEVSETLWNKLQPSRMPDFNWSTFSSPTIDFQIHSAALNIQRNTLNKLFGTYTLGRLHNNLQRVADNADKYTMLEMFGDVRRSIWYEVINPRNINSYKRQLQLAHLQKISELFLTSSDSYPADALTLAGNDLDIIESVTKKALNNSSNLNEMTKAHLKEVLRQIDATKGSKRTYSRN